MPTRFEVWLRDTDALDGTATHAEIAVIFGTGVEEVTLLLMLYVPNAVTAPVPAFLGFNFWGNHSVHPDPAIALHTGWMPHRPGKGVVAHRATDVGRGAMPRRWPLTRSARDRRARCANQMSEAQLISALFLILCARYENVTTH